MKKYYYVETYTDTCAIYAAETDNEAIARAGRDCGQGNIRCYREATPRDIQNVRGSYGYIPPLE